MSELSHLDQLEAEAIYIIREVAASCEKQTKKVYHYFRLYNGCGTRIRTQTNRVRVCRATVTQYRIIGRQQE